MNKRLTLNDVELYEIPWSEPVITRELPSVPSEVYSERVAKVRELMQEQNFTHLVVYGDREHFPTTRFLTGYDPRFEESLIIIGLSGKPLLLVGLEGLYYAQIAQGVEVELYDEFSLPGQPRRGRTFADILDYCGLAFGSKVGVAGNKYLETDHFSASPVKTDVPYYLVDALVRTAGKGKVHDLTRWFTDSQKGLRIPLTVDEIARSEVLNQLVYSGMRQAISALKPGVAEWEISRKLQFDGSAPLSCHIVVSFGENVPLALNSPTNNRLKLGDQLSVALGVWGANSARTGIAVYSPENLPAGIEDTQEKVYVPYFQMLLRWYKALRVGVKGGAVYDSVGEYMEDPFFQVSLNAGHLIRDEEWINAPFVPGSQDLLVSGTMIQCDIIVPSTPPYPGAHTEDGLVVADGDLRKELQEKYPEVWARIQRRRELMTGRMGYELHDDVLPLSEMQGQVTPFMLSPTLVLGLK